MAHATPRSIGLVLSGGGTRLFAHIGFLWALDDAGLLAAGAPLGAVVGNSAGSLVGAMLALGYRPREMWETAYWRVWGYAPPAEPRAWRADPRPRDLAVAVSPDLDGLAHALTSNIAHFKGIDTGERFEALLQRILERTLLDGRPNPDFRGTRPAEECLPLYLIGFNLTNRRETVLQYVSHLPGALRASLGALPTALGREASYEVVSDAERDVPPKERFRPWEGVRISTCLPLIFRPYFKERFVSTHWDAQGQPQRLVQGAYFGDGGSRDNYPLGGALKLAGCAAAFGCFLGDPGYPYEVFGTGTAVDLVNRNVEGMMAALFEADQDDGEISAHPVRTLVPHIEARPGVTFDVTRAGLTMEAGYIVAAYYLRRLRPEVEDDRRFLAALVAGDVRVTWDEVFAAGEETWGPAARGRVSLWAVGTRPSDYFIIRAPTAFQEMATAFFARQFPGARDAAAPLSPLEEEIERRDRERREVAPDELDRPPFSDAPLALGQRRVVRWAEGVSWAASAGAIGALGSAVLAAWALLGNAAHVLPAPDPVEMWAAEAGLLVASIAIGWLVRRAAVSLLWKRLQQVIRQKIGL